MTTLAATRHPSRPPDIERLIRILQSSNVDYVLIGSVAAAVYGVDVRAGDLDIVPNTEQLNLERLINVLAEIEGRPLGPFGEWRLLENREWKWIAHATTDQELADWRPDARDACTLDHLFGTCLGNFDVVPEIAGRYEALRPRAVLRSWCSCNVRVAHIDELLARISIPRREKDRDRVEALRDIQRRSV